MSRPLLLVIALSIACMVAATGGSSATGAGGWANLGTGSVAATPALNGGVYALNTDAPGVVYAAGTFTDAGGDPNADYISSWNGAKWSAIGAQPLNGAVHTIAYANGKVYVGGVFTNAGGNANADFLAVWDGVSWGPVCKAPSSPITATVFALEVVGATLYVGGRSRTVPGSVQPTTCSPAT